MSQELVSKLLLVGCGVLLTLGTATVIVGRIGEGAITLACSLALWLLSD